MRIFILGGSAAMGTPDSSFGFGAILEILLEEAYPETDFTVVNAAMAAINSHVVVEIARECAARRPDLFLVYLGNNEVVGPFGPGTVFGRFSPSATLVRLATWLPRLRLAQLMKAGLSRWTDGNPEPSQWRGLEMFVDQRIPADDPRLEGVYSHLERNLTEIARLARGAGADAIFATVATNLKGQPALCQPRAHVARAGETAAVRGVARAGAFRTPQGRERCRRRGAAASGIGRPGGRRSALSARLDAAGGRALGGP